MNIFRLTIIAPTVAFLSLIATFVLNQYCAAQQASVATQDGVEVLTRGPVHEAFAETVTFDPEPGIVVPKAPPNPIEEMPPDQRPEGPNVAWIPGYWGWDDERNDFLWISGIWRALPRVANGCQDIGASPGKALNGSQAIGPMRRLSEIEYLPEPPATVEAGPNIAAPSADQIWLPGCWIWQQNRYAWRPGYWAQGNQDWDWVPPIMYGLPAATCSSMATMTTRFRVAASCLRPSILMRVSAPSAVTRTRLRR